MGRICAACSFGAVTVTAARGQFLGTDDPDTILLRLIDGVLVQDLPKNPSPRVLSFAQHTIPINLPRMEAFRQRGGKEVELTLPELVREGADRARTIASRAPSIAATQRRIIQVVIMGFLPLLAVALAVPPKRSSSAIGVFLGILLLVGYHKSSEYTERVGSAGQIDPFWGQWLPFIAFAGLCVWLYGILAYKAAGAPIGGLERGASAIGKAVGALFARRSLQAEAA
jgi:lipopolysaccharide export system permease protein